MGSPEAESAWKPPPLPLFYQEEYGLEIKDRRLLRKGINRFLSAIYGEPRYLSQILQQGGIGKRRIARLRSDHLDEFLQRLIAAWRWWLGKALSPEAETLLVVYYDLDSSRPESLATRSGDAREAGIPGAQLWYNALTVLRRPKQVATLEHLVVEVARHTLGEAGDF